MLSVLPRGIVLIIQTTFGERQKSGAEIVGYGVRSEQNGGCIMGRKRSRGTTIESVHHKNRVDTTTKITWIRPSVLVRKVILNS